MGIDDGIFTLEHVESKLSSAVHKRLGRSNEDTTAMQNLPGVRDGSEHALMCPRCRFGLEADKVSFQAIELAGFSEMFELMSTCSV